MRPIVPQPPRRDEDDFYSPGVLGFAAAVLSLAGLAWAAFGLWIVYSNDCFTGECTESDGFGFGVLALAIVQVALAVPTITLFVRTLMSDERPATATKMTLAALGATVALVCLALLGLSIGS